MTSTTPATGSVEEALREAVAVHGLERSPLLPILHSIHDAFGYLPDEVEPLVAEALNLSVAEVHGVITFYRDFRRTRPGASTLRVCRSEACQALGATALLDHARARLGVDVGDTTGDGEMTLGEVFCLGNCALGPSVQLDGRVHGRVSADRLDALLGDRGTGR